MKTKPKVSPGSLFFSQRRREFLCLVTVTNKTPKTPSLSFSNAKTMSEPPNTSKTISIAIPHSQHYHNRHQHPQQHLPPLIHGGNPTVATTSSTSPHFREYRKGNWTLEETLVLITAKKLDDERRTRPTANPPDPTTPRATGELRWKWVENFCWSNGCHRSQNQCNDKWDNLLRDYKKVREYELKSSQSQSNLPSYWAMDKQQRKDQNLPSNLTHQIYEALKDVVQKRCPQKLPTTTQPPPLAAFQPLPLLPPPPSTVAPATVVSEESDSSETDWSGKLDPDTKRRRVRGMGSSIVRGASVLARTIRSCEEKKEKRHREIMELEERRLQADEAQNEVQRQGIASLVAAVNNLSGAIQSLISDRPA